jgi:hypothetical protein
MPRVCETGVIPTLGYVAIYACFFLNAFAERTKRTARYGAAGLFEAWLRKWSRL